MRIMPFAVAAALLVALPAGSAEARAHCRAGKLYRPSLGTCVSPASFARHVLRHVPRRHARLVVRERVRVVRVYVERPASSPEPSPARAEAAEVPVPLAPYVAAGAQSLDPRPKPRLWSGP